MEYHKLSPPKKITVYYENDYNITDIYLHNLQSVILLDIIGVCDNDNAFCFLDLQNKEYYFLKKFIYFTCENQ